MNNNPGSPEAVKAGCMCPVLDNGHGKGNGYADSNGNPLFWFDERCPIHGKAVRVPMDEICHKINIQIEETKANDAEGD